MSRKISVEKANLIFEGNTTSNYILEIPKNDENAQSVSDIYNYLSGNILRKVDKANMLNSIELREPFLDFRLFQIMLSTKQDEKFTEKVKNSLRNILSHYLNPEIWESPKSGFSVPVDIWLRGTLQNRLKKAIDKLDEIRLINKKQTSQLLNKMIKGDDSDVDFLAYFNFGGICI